MRPLKVYYAHPISLYGTPQEERDLKLLEYLHPKAIIYNPATDKGVEEGYKEKGMRYFYEIINHCDFLYFRAFPDLKIGAGVWGEIQHGVKESCIVLELPILLESRMLSINDTREYLKQCGNR
ncbi:MAG: hypothetical protein DRI84_02900 [Bacteroidetes bacterium]|nr:MAG: hypothetical protein DRI84_02900 [Bacteroidota bacterium]